MHLENVSRKNMLKRNILSRDEMLVNKINVDSICKLTALCLLVIYHLKFPKSPKSLVFWIKLRLHCINPLVIAALVRIYSDDCDQGVLLGCSVLSAVNLWMKWARTYPFVWEADIYTRILFKKCWSCTSWPWYVSEAEMGFPFSTTMT